MARPKTAAPDSINEEYYQISEEILSSFPKYRPPVDLYRFREEIAVLEPLCRKGQRLTNEQVEEVQGLCESGDLFVARSDHPIYSEHIVKQLDLVLQDANLKETEVADICVRAIIMRLTEFINQPVKVVFEPLYRDIMVFTEWLWQDRHRIKFFLRRIFHDHSLPNHSFNTLAVGLWLWMETTNEYRRRDLDRVSLALLLHDIGMARIPQFIITKVGVLKPEEREKVLMHPLVGYKTMQRIDLAFEELTRAILEHHERLDGSGYPQRTKGENISKLGRICGIADTFSAMIAKRPYAESKDIEPAARELASMRERYDSRFSAMLLGAVASGFFDGKSRTAEATTPAAPAAPTKDDGAPAPAPETSAAT